MVDAPKNVARKPRGARAKNPIQIPVTPEERAAITQTAKNCNMPVAALLRQLGLGYQPRSISDLLTQRELMRMRGDLGRFGGLLKLWLVDAPGKAVSEREVRDALNHALETMDEVRAFLAAFHEIAERFSKQ